MIDIDYLKSWVGRTEEAADVATRSPVQRLAALLDHETPPWPRDALPPLAHWLYFLPRARQSEIGPDGHPKRGGFLPPVPLPRRMWAGSRIESLAPVPLGAVLTRRSTVQSVEMKGGASGEMVFITVRHEIARDGKAAIVEEQDIVYREASRSDETASKIRPSSETVPASEWSRTVAPDPVQLFRYSALTFNGHRIHYDRDYARDVEGYPGLVMHGPYTATLLTDHFLRRFPERRIAKIAFRARRPLFAGQPIQLCGKITPRGADLWARSSAGHSAMDLMAETAPEATPRHQMAK